MATTTKPRTAPKRPPRGGPKETPPRPKLSAESDGASGGTAAPPANGSARSSKPPAQATAARDSSPKSGSTWTPPRNPILDIPVSYKGVAFGDEVASIGFSADRAVLPVLAADEHLCGKRLRAHMVQGGADNAPGQTLAEGSTVLSADFDVKAYRVSAKQISSTLSMSIGSIDSSSLPHFAKRNGRLIVEAITELAKPSKDMPLDNGGTVGLFDGGEDDEEDPDDDDDDDSDDGDDDDADDDDDDLDDV